MTSGILFRRELDRSFLKNLDSNLPRSAKISICFRRSEKVDYDTWVRVFALKKGEDPNAFEKMRLLAVYYPTGEGQLQARSVMLYSDEIKLICQSTTQNYKVELSGVRFK